ncbi:MAG: MlaD family protein [Actinomycetota bacterium]|nr:MlaD family protein [Actinomycetota bacterium]
MRTAERQRRLSDWVVGLIIVAIIAAGSYLAYTKSLPWSKGFEVTATFSNAHSLRSTAPVRIAGVNVGEVTAVERVEGSEEAAAAVTMEITDNALPVHSDASFKIRPRLFLEGNYFIELRPGSPSAESIDSGHSFPVNQTSTSVGLDQVLTTLQSDVRSDLQTLLFELGKALTVHGGADGFRELHRSSPRAYRYTAVVNEAFLGTEQHDLSGTIAGLEKVLGGLSKNQRELSDLVTHFATFTGSFAAEDEALARAIEQLPDTLAAGTPAFTDLNKAFPSLRAFAREALPGVRSTPAALRASRPFFAQLGALMGPSELGGLVSDLRPTVPKLINLAQGNLSFLEQSRALSSCFNEVIIPWSKSEVEPVDLTGIFYPHDSFGHTFEETSYGITGIAGESRSGDANGQHLRVLGAGGSNLVRVPQLDGTTDQAFGLTQFPILGAMPRFTDSARPAFKPNARCERQERPSLQAGVGSPPPQSTVAAGLQGPEALSGAELRTFEQYSDLITQVAAQGDAADPKLVKQATRAMGQLGLPAEGLPEIAR